MFILIKTDDCEKCEFFREKDKQKSCEQPNILKQTNNTGHFNKNITNIIKNECGYFELIKILKK